MTKNTQKIRGRKLRVGDILFGKTISMITEFRSTSYVDNHYVFQSTAYFSDGSKVMIEDSASIIVERVEDIDNGH